GTVPADGKEYNAEFTVSDGAGGVTDIQSITLSKVNPAGDFNCNAEIDLGDAIIGLQILVSIEPAEQFCYSNIAGEDNIGLADVICILQDIAELKN
ncbi:MAG: hypothetical protein V2I97_20790, partial [Desulfococcaceae bacterium]|nr:hypothetical protein [Desulfococcaceae bacterium]